MEGLRWILLAIGALLVVGIYWYGRRRSLQKKDDFYQPSVSDVPSFSARDTDDDWHHDVGPVRVVSRREEPKIPKLKPELDGHITEDEPVQPVAVEKTESGTGAVNPTVDDYDYPPAAFTEQAGSISAAESPEVDDVESQSESPEVEQPSEPDDNDVDDVIVLYLVAPRGEFIKGEQLLSAAMASDLHFGDMEIFHRLTPDQQILFSLADMMEPGSFEFEKMHEHRTRGVSLFIQLSLCVDPVQALDDMLIFAHHLASMLELQICDHNRQLLNESVAASLRAKAKHVRDLKRGTLQS